MPQHHDTGYKKLYTFPKMVEDLLTGFVHQDWIQELDFSTLEKLNNSYVTDEFRERSDDNYPDTEGYAFENAGCMSIY